MSLPGLPQHTLSMLHEKAGLGVFAFECVASRAKVGHGALGEDEVPACCSGGRRHEERFGLRDRHAQRRLHR